MNKITLLYHFNNEREEREISLSSFQEYFDFLWNIGAGVDKGDQKLKLWWAETYRNLINPNYQFGPFNIALPRSKEHRIVKILSRKII